MTELIIDRVIMIEIKDLPEFIHIGFLLAIISHLFYFLFMLTFKLFRKEKQILDLKKINDVCSICLESINNETQLLCSHSYCADCIISYGKQRFNLRNIECPICRRISKLIFCQFEKNDQNKKTYDQILNYNYEMTSERTTLCLSYDIFTFARYYFKQISNTRYNRKREISILLGIVIFFIILFPICLKFSDNFELIEDIVFYLSLIIIITEIFYRNIRQRINAEYLSNLIY